MSEAVTPPEGPMTVRSEARDRISTPQPHTTVTREELEMLWRQAEMISDATAGRDGQAEWLCWFCFNGQRYTGVEIPPLAHDSIDMIGDHTITVEAPTPDWQGPYTS